MRALGSAHHTSSKSQNEDIPLFAATRLVRVFVALDRTRQPRRFLNVLGGLAGSLVRRGLHLEHSLQDFIAGGRRG